MDQSSRFIVWLRGITAGTCIGLLGAVGVLLVAAVTAKDFPRSDLVYVLILLLAWLAPAFICTIMGATLAIAAKANTHWPAWLLGGLIISAWMGLLILSSFKTDPAIGISVMAINCWLSGWSAIWVIRKAAPLNCPKVPVGYEEHFAVDSRPTKTAIRSALDSVQEDEKR